ncbi:MAG: tetratricopeptide repeat protein [Myxococcota bacterium]
MAWWRRALGRSRRAPEDADEALRGALLAVLDHDLDEAERLLTAAVQLDSSGVEPYLALARLYRMRGEIGRAIRVHQNLLLRHDLSEEQTRAALADLALDFQKGGFLQRAIASWDEVLAHDPRHETALRALVSLLQDVRDYDRAIEVARRLAKVDREAAAEVANEAALLVKSAQAAHAEGRSDDARKALKRALRRDGSLVSAWIALGEIEAERGRNKAALAAWSKVPSLDPNAGAQVYPRLETAYAAADRARDFEDFLSKRLDEAPDDRQARLALARTLAARGAVDEALGQLRAVAEADPDDPEPLMVTGRILLAEGRDGEANKALAELLDVLERRRLPRRGESLT